MISDKMQLDGTGLRGVTREAYSLKTFELGSIFAEMGESPKSV